MIYAKLGREENWQASLERATELLGDSGWGEGKAMLEARRDAGLGPVQLDIPKGAVCLRDLRVW